MKFVHFADLHLDTKFDSLSQISKMPEKRRLEQRKVLKYLIEYVEINKIDVLLISGDLYEQKYIRKASIDYLNELFKKIPDTKIFISPGNHDPYIANSFYNTYNWNENVHIFKNKIEKIDLGEVNIYGLGFDNYYLEDSGIEKIKLDEPEKINILITHSSLDGRGEDYKKYNPLSKSKLKKIGFDYIALGHTHKPYFDEEQDQRIVYPGSLLSLGFDEPGSHGFISGEITKDSLKFEFLEADNRQFVEKTIDITECSMQEELIEFLQEAPLEEQNFYKIILEGTRNFPIDTSKIQNLCERSNIVKIKDNTKLAIDYIKLSKEKSVKGIFVKRMLERQAKEGLDEEFVAKTIEIGLEVL